MIYVKRDPRLDKYLFKFHHFSDQNLAPNSINTKNASDSDLKPDPTFLTLYLLNFDIKDFNPVKRPLWDGPINVSSLLLLDVQKKKPTPCH